MKENYILQLLFQSAQHLYEKREGSGSGRPKNIRILCSRIPNTGNCLPCGRAAGCRLTGVLGCSLSRTPGVLSARLEPVEEPVSCRCRDAVRWLPLATAAVATLLLNPREIMLSCFDFKSLNQRIACNYKTVVPTTVIILKFQKRFQVESNSSI